jgi:hypothetical protein
MNLELLKLHSYWFEGTHAKGLALSVSQTYSSRKDQQYLLGIKEGTTIISLFVLSF